MEISSRTLISLFRPGSVHNGSVSWDDCDWVLPDFQLVSGYVPTLCLDYGIVNPLWLCWVMGICVLRCNLQSTLLVEWPGSFTCHCFNMGVEWTLDKSQHTKWTLKKKILLPLLLGFKLATFWSWVQRSNRQAIFRVVIKRWIQLYMTPWLFLKQGPGHNPFWGIFMSWGHQGNPGQKWGWDVGLRCSRQNGRCRSMLQSTKWLSYQEHPWKQQVSLYRFPLLGQRKKEWVIHVWRDEGPQFKEGNGDNCG